MRTHDLTKANTGLILEVLRMLRPQTLSGARKIRLGRNNDGGYVMLDDFTDVEAAYSIGINDDVSWDRDIVARGIPVFQYDHTIEEAPERHPLMKWRKLGLDGTADPERNLITLSEALGQNGHLAAKNLILKCDIEGYEWHVFRSISRTVLNMFEQIVMEIHAFDYFVESDVADRIHDSLSSITSTHNLVHVHANNYASWAVIGGVAVPSVLEVLFVRKDMGCFYASKEIFPTSLDMPCNPDVADYHLGEFVY